MTMKKLKFPFEKLRTRKVDNTSGLVLAIAQDYKTKEILMTAYTNRKGIEKTIGTGIAHYYSTSRKKLWMKGEKCGNVQKVKEILIDCDGDVIIFRVEQKGGACHDGYRTCFYRKLGGNRFRIIRKKIFNPSDIYGKG